MVRLLLARTADLNTATTDTGNTALILSSQNGHLEAVQLLFEHSAEPPHPTPHPTHTLNFEHNERIKEVK